MTLIVSGGDGGTFGLGLVVSGSRFSFHIQVCLQHSDSKMGRFVEVLFVVSSS